MAHSNKMRLIYPSAGQRQRAARVNLSSEFSVCTGTGHIPRRHHISIFTFIVGGLALCLYVKCASVVLYRFKGRTDVPCELSSTSHSTFNFNFLLPIFFFCKMCRKSRSTSRHPSAVSKAWSFAGESPKNVLRNAIPCPFRPSALLRFNQSKTKYPDFFFPLLTDDDDLDLLFLAPQGEKSSPLPSTTVSKPIQPQPQVPKETAEPLPSSSTTEVGLIKESEALDVSRVASCSGLPYCFVDNKFGRAEDALKAAMARMAQPRSSPVSCCCCYILSSTNPSKGGQTG